MIANSENLSGEIKALVEAEMEEFRNGAYSDHGSARDQLERFAAAINRASIKTLASSVPEIDFGTWLWVELMAYCKKMGIAPATQNELFSLVSRARLTFNTSRINTTHQISTEEGSCKCN